MMNLTVITTWQSRSMMLTPAIAPSSRRLWNIFLSLDQTRRKGAMKWELKWKWYLSEVDMKLRLYCTKIWGACKLKMVYRVYYGVKKNSKTKQAMHHGQVMSVDLCKLKRVWHPMISELSFSGGLNIVKKGSWDWKDDPHNVYNSVTDITFRRIWILIHRHGFYSSFPTPMKLKNNIDGFCSIQNDKGRGKCYQPRWRPRLITIIETFII